MLSTRSSGLNMQEPYKYFNNPQSPSTGGEICTESAHIGRVPAENAFPFATLGPLSGRRILLAEAESASCEVRWVSG